MTKVLSILIAITVFCSCKKEGCTDTSAKNYTIGAELDDNSCLYEGSAIFWINANTGSSYQSSNINELRFYVDDSFIGIMGTNSSLVSAPTCETGGGVNHYEDLSSNPDKIARYRVTYVPYSPPGVPTPDEVTEAEGSFKLVGGQCVSFQIQ